MNLLIVEDEPSVADSLKRIFLRVPRVQNVLILHDTEQAFGMALSGIYDVLIIDIVLGVDSRAGIQLCKEIRQHNRNVPLIIVTGVQSVSLLSEAFDIGVNEYITKPFDNSELEVRVKRWFGKDFLISQKDLSYKELHYDAVHHEFTFKGMPLKLSRKNKSLLLLFLRSPERLLPQDLLMQKYWGDLEHNPHRNLRQCLSSLRKNLGSPCKDWIHVVHGQGYYLKKR